MRGKKKKNRREHHSAMRDQKHVIQLNKKPEESGNENASKILKQPVFCPSSFYQQ